MKQQDHGATSGVALELLWKPAKHHPTRGPKRAHSLDHVLDIAIGIADRDGLDLVSMQRLAQELKFTKMAVYRYVPGRSELTALMTDRALGAPPNFRRGGGWRGQIEAWSSALFDVLSRHPWVLRPMAELRRAGSSLAETRLVGPNESQWTEIGLGILVETGLSGSDRLEALAAIVGQLRAAADQTVFSRAAIPGYGAALAGRETQFPELAFVVTESRGAALPSNGLAFGLKCILDGIDAHASKKPIRKSKSAAATSRA